MFKSFYVRNLQMFLVLAPGKQFEPSLIFANKVHHPREGSWPYPQTLTRLERLTRDKRSSLKGLLGTNTLAYYA